MKRPFLHRLLYLWLFGISIPAGLSAQETQQETCWQKELNRAMLLLDAFKNDSADIVLQQLLTTLEDNDAENSSLGLEVQVRRAEVLEKDHRDEAAIQQLLSVTDASRVQGQWSVFANAQLSLARLHEKMGRSDSCKADLQRAQHAIRRHEIDSLYPRLAIRLASYYRIFGQRDSALYFSQEVLRTAPQFGQDSHKGTGHMLMGLLQTEEAPREALGHFVAAAKIFLEKENFSGRAFILNNLSRLYFKQNQLEQALAYNDSFLVAAKLAVQNGSKEYHLLSSYSQDRAQIYRKMGEYDSAYHYLEAAYQFELDDVLASNQEKVVAIEARYKDEKKTQKIEEQEQQLSYERSRRNRTLWGATLILIFSSIITYFYLQLRRANQKTTAQATIIKRTNAELSESLRQQVMLQSEIHHRVKNNLQVIISLLELQSGDIEDPKALHSLQAMSNRIYSMAAIHELLYQYEGTELVKIGDYVQTLCDYFRTFIAPQESPVFKLTIDKYHFNLPTLMPLGIILNELLTNSLKYASLPDQALKIQISLQKEGDYFCLYYRDNGPGFPKDTLKKRAGGLGMYLLKSMSRQLRGYLESSNQNGAVYRIFFKEKNKVANYELL